LTFRYLLHLLILAAVIASLAASPARADAPTASWCQSMQITGYVRTEFSPWTADGTSVYTDEPIAAASWNVPMGSYVDVAGVGRFRVADRGLLGSSGWIDVAVWSRSEAYSLTGVRTVCVIPPGEAT
jgi:3D (Asp-Asp-Asp) domain-containing protein